MQPASPAQPISASPRACSCTPAARPPTCCCGQYITHIYIQYIGAFSPSALPTYHAMGLQAEHEQESLPKAQAIGGWVVVEAKQRIHPSPARGAVGKASKAKKDSRKLCAFVLLFLSRAGALAFPTAGFLFLL